VKDCYQNVQRLVHWRPKFIRSIFNNSVFFLTEDIVCQDTDQPVNAEWLYDPCLLCPLLEIRFKVNLQSFTFCMCERRWGGGHSNTYVATKL
jgi:hypothetical protein